MQTVLQPANDRVRDHTADKINKKIDQKIQENIHKFSWKDKNAIETRLKELEKEWDIERALELTASTVAFSGVLLAATVNKKWLILPAVVTAFLAQHATQGWCPPLSLFRRLGVRTQKEIDMERDALQELLKGEQVV